MYPLSALAFHPVSSAWINDVPSCVRCAVLWQQLLMEAPVRKVDVRCCVITEQSASDDHHYSACMQMEESIHQV